MGGFGLRRAHTTLIIDDGFVIMTMLMKTTCVRASWNSNGLCRMRDEKGRACLCICACVRVCYVYAVFVLVFLRMRRMHTYAIVFEGVETRVPILYSACNFLRKIFGPAFARIFDKNATLFAYSLILGTECKNTRTYNSL